MKTLRERQEENAEFPWPVRQLFNVLDRVIPAPAPRLVFSVGDRSAVKGPPKRRVFNTQAADQSAKQD